MRGSGGVGSVLPQGHTDARVCVHQAEKWNNEHGYAEPGINMKRQWVDFQVKIMDEKKILY